MVAINNILPEGVSLGVTLDRYQELMRLPVAAFNGLNKPDETPVYECSKIWKQSERDALALALSQAEEMREQELAYHISPKYDVIDNMEIANPALLPKKHLIKLGLQVVEDISLDVTIDYGTLSDLVTVVLPAGGGVAKDEVKVYVADTDFQITPSSVYVSGGNIIIKILRSRLVKPELLDDRDDHMYYNDNNNFIEKIDVRRVYYDATNPGQYVWTETCSSVVNEAYQSMYAHVFDHRVALVRHYPADYKPDFWVKQCWKEGRPPDYMRFYALSGRRSSVYTEMQTIRLAHTLMPNAPCSCPTVHQYWERDMADANIITPYGRTQGAVDAWAADSRAKVGQGGKFPIMRGRY